MAHAEQSLHNSDDSVQEAKRAAAEAYGNHELATRDFQTYIDTLMEGKSRDSAESSALNDWVTLITEESRVKELDVRLKAADASSDEHTVLQKQLDGAKKGLRVVEEFSNLSKESFAPKQMDAEGESFRPENPYEKTMTILKSIWQPKLVKAQEDVMIHLQGAKGVNQDLLTSAATREVATNVSVMLTTQRMRLAQKALAKAA
jgi:hypothetical protein